MSARSLERLYDRKEEIDICESCQGLWFDDQELLQLTPGSTLDLLSFIAGQPQGARVPLSAQMACPRCSTKLRQVSDMQRNTKFSYFRCPRNHGRFLTFFQFLRAKNFVRNLVAVEITELRRHIRQVNCSNCGAPVDIGRAAACEHCRTPIAILDPEQVSKAVSELRRAEIRQETVDPAWPMRAALERISAERAFSNAANAPAPPAFTELLAGDLPDLIASGIRALKHLLG
jgi:Zn-finger nucleic acid-binding protein